MRGVRARRVPAVALERRRDFPRNEASSRLAVAWRRSNCDLDRAEIRIICGWVRPATGRAAAGRKTKGSVANEPYARTLVAHSDRALRLPSRAASPRHRRTNPYQRLSAKSAFVSFVSACGRRAAAFQ